MYYTLMEHKMVVYLNKPSSRGNCTFKSCNKKNGRVYGTCDNFFMNSVISYITLNNYFFNNVVLINYVQKFAVKTSRESEKMYLTRRKMPRRTIYNFLSVSV